MEKMSKMKAIREYFEKDNGRKVSLAELKALTPEDREELSTLAATELGIELTDNPTP